MQKVDPEKYKQVYETKAEEPKQEEVKESLIVLGDDAGANQKQAQKGLANEMGDLQITQSSGSKVESANQNTAQKNENNGLENLDADDKSKGNPAEVQIINEEGEKIGEQKVEL